jgi:hypothetical protein
MNNKIRKTISFFTLSCAIIVASCQNDEIEKLNQDPAVVNAEKWLENNKYILEVLKYTEDIDWSNAIVLNNNDEEAIEVPLKLVKNTSTNVIDDIDYKTYMRLLLIKNLEGGYKVFDIVYTTKDSSFNINDKSFNILDIGSQYSGYITIKKSDNKIAYSGKYENGELSALHNYEQVQSLTNRLVCSYYVTVGPYTTCSNWVWYPDYGPGNLPYGYMPGISGPIFPFGKPYTDPCTAATTATMVSKNTGYTNAVAAIMQASIDGNEHSITLGTATSGVYSQAPMNHGGTNGVQVNLNLPGAWGAIHNHPNNTPLSSGDIYTAVTLATKVDNFNVSIILTGGETYAIYVTNLALAQSFVSEYPPDLSPNYPPEFPTFIFDQIDLVKSKIGNSNESRTAAISSILDKYNSGITLLKLDSSGNFNRVKIQETTMPDGSKTYISVPCK